MTSDREVEATFGHQPEIHDGRSRASWLPLGMQGAVCFTVDDVHPGKSSDGNEAGGDLERGALRHIQWLLERHPELRVTLFITADWREISPWPSRRVLARIPFLREQFHLTEILPRGTMRLDRHPEFVRFLLQMPRTDFALHGLHHVSKGMRVPVEFQRQSIAQCRRMLEEALSIFKEAGLPVTPGMQPPAWNAPAALLEAMIALRLQFVASARDINTPIAPDAVTNMSGLRGVSLVQPEFIRNGRLVHFTSNFQATSPVTRAFEIIDAGGLVAIKAHIMKYSVGHVALDGMDENYRQYLDELFTALRERYGSRLWWTTMGKIAQRMHGAPD